MDSASVALASPNTPVTALNDKVQQASLDRLVTMGRKVGWARLADLAMSVGGLKRECLE
jgi:hypothetical protein